MDKLAQIKSTIPNLKSCRLQKLPDSPGVYLFYGQDKELLYVGKAASLRSRVASYFRGPASTRPIESMMRAVKDVKWQETDSVLEAIILEANYIKRYQPKYNVEGKDDKSWNYIVITDEEYPRVETIRQHEIENVQNTKVAKLRNQRYVFGPYPGLNTKATMKLLRRLFQFSSCQQSAKHRNIKAGKERSINQRPCLYYQLGQCRGVCTGEISAAEYKRKVIRPLVIFLRGRKKQLIQHLEAQMKQESKAQNFEEAARRRNQIAALQRIQDVALLNQSFVEDDRRVTDSAPARIQKIEGYDISNFGASGVVGSLVVFVDGEADKSQYRRFKIRTFKGQSDVAALAEVLSRRLKHKEWPMPDVFLIDGGKPQVNRGRKVLREFGLSIPIVGIAKGVERKRNDFLIDFSGRGDFARWVDNNRQLLIKVRDEAHRFAVGYQRQLRKISTRKG